MCLPEEVVDELDTVTGAESAEGPEEKDREPPMTEDKRLSPAWHLPYAREYSASASGSFH